MLEAKRLMLSLERNFKQSRSCFRTKIMRNKDTKKATIFQTRHLKIALLCDAFKND
jgi:hypothetical protein